MNALEPELENSEHPYVLPNNYNFSGNKFDVIDIKNYDYYFGETSQTKITHRLDTYPNIGFNYFKYGVLTKSIPGIYLKENYRKYFIENMDKLMIRLIDSVKGIKQFYNIYVPLHFKTFN